MEKVYIELATLIKAVLNKTKYTGFDTTLISQFVSVSKKHDIFPIVAKGLLDSGLKFSDKQKSILNNEMTKAISRSERQDYDASKLFNIFNENKIDFVPLKGVVIKSMYGEPWERTSCDIDILIKKEEVQKALSLLDNYYKIGRREFHNINITTEQNVAIELHFSIKENIQSFDSVLSNAWDYAIKKENTYQYEFTPEFLYFHILSHMAYHFKCGGCGIKSLVDIYLLESKLNINREVLLDLIKRAGLEKFYNSINDLVGVLFDGKTSTKELDDIMDYIVDGGAYGDVKQQMVNDRAGQSKIKFIFKRIFIPYNQMKEIYPKLEKQKILLPFYWTVRLFSAVDRKKRIDDELRNFDKNDQGKLLERKKLLDDLEIK